MHLNLVDVLLAVLVILGAVAGWQRGFLRATASLFASISIGFGSLWLGRGIRCPMTALYIPALLPMVPGIYAYKTVFSLIMFLQSLNDPGEGLQYMQQFFLNATVSLSVIALLAAGATLPIFVFNHQAFSLTRRRKHTDK